MTSTEYKKLEDMLLEKAILSGPTSALNLIFDAVKRVKERGGTVRGKPLRKLVTTIVQATIPEIARQT